MASAPFPSCETPYSISQSLGKQSKTFIQRGSLKYYKDIKHHLEARLHPSKQCISLDYPCSHKIPQKLGMTMMSTAKKALYTIVILRCLPRCLANLSLQFQSSPITDLKRFSINIGSSIPATDLCLCPRRSLGC